VDLQPHGRVIRRAAGSCWRRPLKSQRLQVELVDECVDYAHRVVTGDEVIEAFRDQRYLLPVLTFDESGHVDSRDRDTKLYLHYRSGVKEFSHSLDPFRPFTSGRPKPLGWRKASVSPR